MKGIETRTRTRCPACKGGEWATEWRGSYLPGNGRGGKGTDCSYPVFICSSCGHEFMSAEEYEVEVEVELPDPEPDVVLVGGFDILDSHGDCCGWYATEAEAANMVAQAAKRGIVRTYRAA